MANRMVEAGHDIAAVRAAVAKVAPDGSLPLAPSQTRSYARNIQAESQDEQANLVAVDATMAELMRTPVVSAGAIMPDACPAGPTVVRQIEHFGLAEVVDHIDPFGCIMAGDWTRSIRKRASQSALERHRVDICPGRSPLMCGTPAMPAPAMTIIAV